MLTFRGMMKLYYCEFPNQGIVEKRFRHHFTRMEEIFGEQDKSFQPPGIHRHPGEDLPPPALVQGQKTREGHLFTLVPCSPSWWSLVTSGHLELNHLELEKYKLKI